MGRSRAAAPAGIAMAALAAFVCAACAHRMPPPELLAGMVPVPAGPFVMGHDPSDGRLGVDVGVDSVPRHEVRVKAFWIDRAEATVADYRAFLAATGTGSISSQAYGGVPLREDLPIIAVNFAEAAAYCRWRGKRLPTEAEWEKAARGTDGRLYPWGNTWDPARAVFDAPDRIGPDPVGSHPAGASPYGALDMAGNAMEWTDTWYEAHPGNDLKRRAFGHVYRILKGGSWDSYPYLLRAANRFSVLPEIGQPSFGVRCVVSGHR